MVLALASGDHSRLTIATARTTTLESSRYAAFDTIREKVSYDSQLVPPRQEDNGMKHSQTAIPLPCSQCLITSMEAALEYSNGTRADANTGMWLHHVVFINRARNDSVCSDNMPQRFFASGNERTRVDLTDQGTHKIGYPILANDAFIMSSELMNMLGNPQEVVLSMIWEYVPSIPDDFKQAVPYWLDVGGCGDSNVPAQANKKFHYKSPAVTADFDGDIAFVAGHLHDGGTEVNLLKNGLKACTSYATYGKSNDAADGTSHITSMQHCVNVGKVQKGQRWSIKALYDTARHAPMKSNDGSLEPVMGIALAYITPSDPNNAPHLGRTSIIFAAILSVMSVGLLGLYFARTRPMDGWWARIRKGRYQRVQLSGNEDDEADENLLPYDNDDPRQ
ncbi:hypothetical protein LTR78_008861 [Recurvomyces mirabilis]|uniref:Uncharacterized protein n=1 Tax=Recurvomyces mirabilis TaxID=574656 RepID=A0AAE0TQ92_9PEZI|nr:hypothetical protein LTR78_008861 [Recurvomyces mirabilis]KAK5155776.1 hypothetical protein LTS14_005342 [Recurvomyces mirabilis]